MRATRGRKLSFSCSAACGEGRGRTSITSGWRDQLLHLFGPTKCLKKLPVWNTAGAERKGCLVQERTCLVCRFMSIDPFEKMWECEFSWKVYISEVALQECSWIWFSCTPFGYQGPYPFFSCFLHKLHVFFFPTDLFFIFNFSTFWLVLL